MQAKGWPARKKWTRGYLRRAFKGQKVVAGNYPMTFDDYLSYLDGATDDMPLYLFDCKFAAKAPALAADYSVRPSFRAAMKCTCLRLCSGLLTAVCIPV